MYSYNPYYANYLMHYGTATSGRYPKGSGARPFQHTGRKIIGRIAQKRAIGYAKDIQQHRKNKEISNLRNEKRTGQITKDEYKKSKLDIKQKYEKALLEDVQNIVNSRKHITEDTSKKISEIYSKYKDTAYKEIPNYLIHKGIRVGAKIGATVLVGLATKTAYKSIIKPYLADLKDVKSMGYTSKQIRKLLKGSPATYSGSGVKGSTVLRKASLTFTGKGNNFNKALAVGILDTSAAGITGAVALNATAKKVSKHTI